MSSDKGAHTNLIASALPEYNELLKACQGNVLTLIYLDKMNSYKGAKENVRILIF